MSSVCKVCLCSNMKMHNIEYTDLQGTYERLSGAILSTKDGRPTTICYICNSQPQRCLTFFNMSQNSDKICKDLMFHNDLMETLTQHNLGWMHHLSVTNLSTISIIDDAYHDHIEKSIKEEPEYIFDIETFPEDLKIEHLDRRITWQTHIKTKREHINMKFRNLAWILGRNSKLTIDNKLLIYKAVFKPIWMYGIQLWVCASNCNISVLQRAQNMILKSIANVPWFITNQEDEHLHMSTVKEEIQLPAAKYKQRLKHHPNQLAAQLTNQTKNPPSTNLLIVARLIANKKKKKCNRSFGRKGTLELHIIRKHTRDTRFICKLCNKTFSSEGSLRRHIKVHNGEYLHNM